MAENQPNNQSNNPAGGHSGNQQNSQSNKQNNAQGRRDGNRNNRNNRDNRDNRENGEKREGRDNRDNRDYRDNRDNRDNRNRNRDRNRNRNQNQNRNRNNAQETRNANADELSELQSAALAEQEEALERTDIPVEENSTLSESHDEEDADDDIGTMQDLEKLKAESKNSKKIRDDEHTPVQTESWEEYLDLDIRTGTSKEAEAISENPFLTRGLSGEPDIEQCSCSQYSARACKLNTSDWMSELEITTDYLDCPIAEVRFKNSHKDFFLLPQEGVFHVGDIVAVEAATGHDIGIISMLGKNVYRQLKHRHVNPDDVKKKIYRTARYTDIDKWISTVKQEHTTMLSSRYIAWDLGLKMKVNDVEYQGDGSKAIFYYSAEDRVDFRELIKILAEQFRIRIEMRQIGVRQEAGRLGGLGTCGRELCCSSWLTNFQSVSTSAARTQQLSPNPQKLAGQCGKLKCCLNFEQATYQEEIKQFPSPNTKLKFKNGTAYYNKIDIFKKIVWFHFSGDNASLFAIPLDKVNEIIELNKKNQFPEKIEEFAVVNQKKEEEVNYSLDELKNIEDK